MNSYFFGPLIEKFYGSINDAPPGLSLISNSDETELYHATMFETGEDEKYIMATHDNLLVEFGVAGLVRSIKKKSGKGLKSILERDGQGRFVFYSENLPANGVIKDPALDRMQLTAKLLDVVYNRARDLPDEPRTYSDTLANKFWNNTGNRVIARFNDFRFLVSRSDIIPDFDEQQVPVVTVMEGCPMLCLYCPISGHMKLYTIDKIKRNISFARETLNTYHNPIKKEFYEGFINASDLLWYRTLTKSSVDPLEIVALYKEAFPNVVRLGTFFGVNNIINVGEEYLEKLINNAGAKNSSARGFGKGITRGYIGIETGHTEGSALLGKHQTFEQKAEAIKILKKAKIGAKIIVQLGVFGEGFYRNKQDVGKRKTKDNFVTWQEALDRTIDLIIRTGPYKVMLSEFLPLEGIGLHKLISEGRIIPYRSQNGIKRELEYIVDKLTHEHSAGNIEWQGRDGRNGDEKPPIEFNYEDFVEGRKKN